MKIQDIITFFSDDLWRQTRYDARSRRQHLGLNTLKVITLCVRGFISKNLNIRANALTYSLMFAIVPIMAMVLDIAQGFGVADIIEAKLKDSFLGEYGLVPTIMEFVQHYMETAQGGVFLGMGLLILIWAVYSFFQNVETAFNDIWNVNKSRSVSRQLVTYIAILVFVPILIVVSSGMLQYIAVVTDVLHHLGLHFLEGSFSAFLPYLTSWVIFSWMYWAIPNTKVGLWAATIPGVLMGTCFQVMQWALVHFVVILSRTSIVYGAFAAIPILLMVLQWSCLLILIGAQMSFAIQNNESFDYEHDIENISKRYSDYLSLFLVSQIVERFCHDELPMTAHEMAAEYQIPLRLVNNLLSHLVATGVLREVYVETKEDRTYQPAMDPQLITIGMVTERLETEGTELFLKNASSDMRRFWKRYLQLRDQHGTLRQVRVSEL